MQRPNFTLSQSLKADITNHLANILGKCSRHIEYYQAAIPAPGRLNEWIF